MRPRGSARGGQRLTLCPATAVVASLLASAAAHGAGPIDCDSCEAWNRPQAPFRVFGNTWYVGTAGLSSLLIDTADGLILLDGALPQSAPQIAANIRSLGFEPADIRLIALSHAHFDHAGGIAALVRLSGATVAASPSAAAVLATGLPGEDDPQFALGHPRFPPVAEVVSVSDGETIVLGDAELRAVFTPGHTPGGTSWTWRSCENGDCAAIVYADSLGAVSAEGFRFGDSPSDAALARSIDAVAALDCDVLLAPHPSFFRMQEKLAAAGGGNPFVDPDGCKTYAAKARAALERRLASESAAE